jgi:hypothetical protein
MDAQVGKLPVFDWTVKKETVGKLKTLRYTLSLKKGSPLEGDVAKKLFGKGLEVYIAVAGTRLLATFGRDAKANLGKLAAAKPVAPSGALAETVAATKDVTASSISMSRPSSRSRAGCRRTRGRKRSRRPRSAHPVFGTAGGDGAGKFWSVDFTIPPAAFTGSASPSRRR